MMPWWQSLFSSIDQVSIKYKHKGKLMIVRKLRLDKGWSQEQLAELCDVNVRTIQRIERGQKPSLETQKSLASVFEINISDLTMETDMTNQAIITSQEEKAIIYVRDIKGFYNHLIRYGVVMIGLLILNIISGPDYFWVIWPALGWGIGVLSHGLSVFEVFDFFGPNWEKRQIKKRLDKGTLQN
jgi:transcriptional regulator with XRE-family HTH domain